MKRTVILFTLLLVIFAAGCTESGDNGDSNAGLFETPSQAYGLSIAEFTSIPKIDTGEEVDIALTIQNVGDSEAKNIEFDMYQMSGFSGSDPDIMTSLLGPDKEIGAEGEKETVFWTLTAPFVSADQTKYLKGRITYDYSSNASTNIHLAGSSEYDELGAGSFSPHTTSSVGPVRISIVEIPAFRVSPGRTEQDVHLSMIIRNIGAGTVVGDIENFEITLLGENAPPVVVDTACEISGSQVKLFGAGQARSLKCDITLPYTSGAISYIAEIGADYEYRIDTPPLGIQVVA